MIGRAARRKLRRALTALLPFFPLLPVIAWSAVPVPGPDTVFPFDASHASSTVEQEFRIREYRPYQFLLQLEYTDSSDLDRLYKIVGTAAKLRDGRYADPGILVRVHLEVSADKTDGPAIFDATVETQSYFSHGFNGRGGGNLRRLIADIRLRPGQYRLRAAAARDTPELAGRPAALVISYDQNSTPLPE